jgi:amino acid permease
MTCNIIVVIIIIIIIIIIILGGGVRDLNITGENTMGSASSWATGAKLQLVFVERKERKVDFRGVRAKNLS